MYVPHCHAFLVNGPTTLFNFAAWAQNATLSYQGHLAMRRSIGHRELPDDIHALLVEDDAPPGGDYR